MIPVAGDFVPADLAAEGEGEEHARTVLVAEQLQHLGGGDSAVRVLPVCRPPSPSALVVPLPLSSAEGEGEQHARTVLVAQQLQHLRRRRGAEV